ncbi:MAG: alpha/beta fold hydrolase [Gammaproteobacteria bacterium]|jgi:polyhydroxyalkanoate synthase
MATEAQRNLELDLWVHDPRPKTPFELIDETHLLRLRYYAPEDHRPELTPVLLVYPMIKRPYVLDLLPERSVVRSFLRQGFRVYLTDWLPPGLEDADCGLDDYVNQELARAIDLVCEREGVTQVSLVGCCCAGLLSAIFAAQHPGRVQNLVTFAAPFEIDPPLGPVAAGQLVLAYGNVPAWMVAAALNFRMQDPFQIAAHLARDLGEPELAEHVLESPAELLRAIRPWLASDVPLAGRLFREIVCEVLPDSNLLESRLRIGGRRVDLKRISCPVLVIAGERDALVPADRSVRFASVVGSRDASELIFPTGHLGLMLSEAAHRGLWPEVGEWLRSRSGEPLRQSA